MRVLVSGAAGYIGSVLTRQLIERGHFVRGLDALLFGGESLLPFWAHRLFEFRKGDIRKREDVMSALKDIDAVVHLAAIVGDPACSAQPTLAREVNWEGSKSLLDVSVSSQTVQRFVFASTCSNYGKMDSEEYLDESSQLRPVSLYAELKVKFEQYLLDVSRKEHFAATALRFATVYGLSPRPRFDLTVNEFVRDLVMGKELEIFGEQFWRPYCHVEDLARSCVLVLESDAQLVGGNVFNVGDTRENYQKKQIAEQVLKYIPGGRVRFVHREEDPRDYKVNFSKIAREIGFEISKTVPDGVSEMVEALRSGIIGDPFSSRFRNI